MPKAPIAYLDPIICKTMEDAQSIIDRMSELCDLYGYATVASLYELADISVPNYPLANGYGWADASDLTIFVNTSSEEYVIIPKYEEKPVNELKCKRSFSSKYDENLEKVAEGKISSNDFRRTYPDLVNHPPHYISESGLETIDVIEAFAADLKGIEAVCTGNVIKYICRWKHKNGLQDLEKAQWYLNHLIDYISKEEN